MNASKENARKAKKAFARIAKHQGLDFHSEIKMVESFLDASERKLPTEAAYKREKQRRAQA